MTSIKMYTICLNEWPLHSYVIYRKKVYLGKVTFVIQNVYKSLGFLGNEINGRLVVMVFDNRPINVLPSVLDLFQSEHVLVEIELQSLIGIVDAQLFEAVHLEVLKI